METDDYYVLLRDAGFVEVVEQNNIAKAIARWCLILTVLCLVLDILFKWVFEAPTPSSFDWHDSALNEVHDTAFTGTKFGLLVFPVVALVAYWIGAKKRNGYIHVGVRAGGTHRGFINGSATITASAQQPRVASRAVATRTARNLVA
jgi:hypothetical protein